MTVRSFALAIALLIAPVLPASAATIDFGEATAGQQGSTFLSLTNVSIVTAVADPSLTAGLFVFAPSATRPTGGFCATVNGACLGSATIGFSLGTVSELAFDVAGFGTGDAAIAITTSDLAGTINGSKFINGNAVLSP